MSHTGASDNIRCQREDSRRRHQCHIFRRLPETGQRQSTSGRGGAASGHCHRRRYLQYTIYLGHYRRQQGRDSHPRTVSCRHDSQCRHCAGGRERPSDELPALHTYLRTGMDIPVHLRGSPAHRQHLSQGDTGEPARDASHMYVLRAALLGEGVRRSAGKNRRGQRSQEGSLQECTAHRTQAQPGVSGTWQAPVTCTQPEIPVLQQDGVQSDT